MDISNITFLVFPLTLNIFQSGVKLREAHCNSFIRYSHCSLYSILAVILSYMNIIGIKDVSFLGVQMNGIMFGVTFALAIGLLIFAHFFIIDQVRKSWLRILLSIFLLLITLVFSIIIIFHEHFFK